MPINQKFLLENITTSIPFLLILGTFFIIPGLSLFILIFYLLFSHNIKSKKIHIKNSLLLFFSILFLSAPIIILINHCSYVLLENFNQQDIVYSVKKDINLNRVINLVIIAPLLEELYFRGILLKHLITFNGPFWAIIISSVYFTIIHFNVLASPTLFVLSIILGIIFVSTQNLIYCLLLHSVFNGIMLIFIL